MGSHATPEPIDRAITRLAVRQYGAVSREQALRIGATKGIIQERLRSGRWERLHPGVYRVAGVPPSWHGSLMAGCLSCGDDAVVSHRAAATLWNMPGPSAELVELTVPRRLGRRRGMIVHRVDLSAIDVTYRGAIPVTTPARTLIHLASVERPGTVEEALDDAIRRNLISLARLRWRIRELEGSGRSGISSIRSMVEVRQPGEPVPQSVFETRLLRSMRAAGLPIPVVQHEIRCEQGLVAVVDFALPAARLAIEADGYRWHSGRARFEHDRARSNALTSLGWKIIHVTWSDLHRREPALMEMLKGAYAEATGDTRRGDP